MRGSKKDFSIIERENLGVNLARKEGCGGGGKKYYCMLKKSCQYL